MHDNIINKKRIKSNRVLSTGETLILAIKKEDSKRPNTSKIIRLSNTLNDQNIKHMFSEQLQYIQLT